ncbi:hypothetical protein AAG570_011166 [Ranatra chinensis]|uniref:Aminopeptidase P N-terminal domain-containing protein n=1 Tax=Ranatra chinensis TaxID=642074 RepID=A0ABD0Z837_9HEMI
MKVSEFVERRERLAKAVSSLKPGLNHVIVIPSSEVLYMSERIPYVFRQNTDFRYLTGCLEPDSVLVLSVSQAGSFKSVLFVRESDARAELWEGPRTGSKYAKEMFRVDETHPISDLLGALEVITRSYSDYILWYEFRNPAHRKLHTSLVPFVANSGMKMIESPKEAMHTLRLIKSKSEQKLLRSSAHIASEAISQAMGVTRPGTTEHQLFATVDYHCRMRGAEFLAYPPVVASGNNANIIHYIHNSQVVRDGELVLMDAGCELHGYCSDITRTWPASGRFSEAQLTLYEIVLDVQEELLAWCSRLPSLDELFNTMCKLLGSKLKEGHVLSRQADKLSLEEVAFKLCPHHVSHYLGMDVHDTGSVPRNLSLKEGMCLTVEPGNCSF